MLSSIFCDRWNPTCSSWGKFDLLWKLSRAGLDKRNACRNLHRLIDRKDILFPVPIDAVKITVAIRKPYYKSTQLWWPILRISDWVPCLVKHSPQAILAGHRLEDVLGWQRAFQDFWKEYKLVNPTHCFYTDGLDAKFSVLFSVHGDEGRGYCRRPYLVESWQPVLGWKGKGATNEGAYFDLEYEYGFCFLQYGGVKYIFNITPFYKHIVV